MLFHPEPEVMLSILLLVGNAAHAGDPCKKFKMEVDPITKAVHQQAAVYLQAEGKVLPWFFDLDEGKLMLTIRVGINGAAREEVFPAGYTFTVLQADQSLLTLTAPAPTLPVSGVGGTVVFTNWMVQIPLDKPTAGALGSQLITAIRYAKPEGADTFEVGKGWASVLQKAIRCLEPGIQEGAVVPQPIGI